MGISLNIDAPLRYILLFHNDLRAEECFHISIVKDCKQLSDSYEMLPSFASRK